MDLVFLLIIAIVLLLATLLAWHKELADFTALAWLRLLIVRDILLRRASFSDLSDTKRYREYRSEMAALEMEDLFLSPELAEYVAVNRTRPGPHGVLLWHLGDGYYTIELMGREITHTEGQFTVASSIEQALDRFREVYPDYDPYTYLTLRLGDTRQIIEDSVRS
jgi:hypothetical protein